MGKNNIEPSGRFAQFMASALAEKQMSLRDLAREIDFSYEHLRMVEIGERPPSEPLLEKICRALGLNFNDMLAVVTRDKIERTHGTAAVAAAFGKSPRLSAYEELIPHLTNDQNRMVLDMMRGMVNANRKAGGRK